MARQTDRTDQAQTYREQVDADRESRFHAIHDRPRFHGLQVDPEVDFYPEVRDREPGDTNIVAKGFDLHPWVTFVSAGLLAVFVGLTLAFPEQTSSAYEATLSFTTERFGWFLIVTANILVVAAIYFALSRYGKIRIGGPDAQPEFTRPAWYAMLLSAGMGIGLMFWSVAEPISHLGEPSPAFDVQPGTEAAGEAALSTTFFHWGLHPWAIYAIVGLALAFFAYNRGLPLTFRSVFYPVLGRRIYGGWGNAIDILTVLATLFGLATSLGLGVGQAAAGLEFLFGWESGTSTQVLMIGGITALATLSVVAGLDQGVKRLSQLNLILAGGFLAFIVLVGPTLFLLSALTQSLGFYIQVLPEQAFYAQAFADSDWQGTWTVFYWGWWISWSPFVGMFIARVSKGRSVRDFISSVVVVPAILSFIWMAVFGGAALDVQLNGIRDLAGAVDEDAATAMFEMLQAFPLTEVASIIAILLVTSFFVTSSDSGSLVVDHLTSGGKLDSPRPQRVFWAVMEGVIAAVLLIGGGLEALQTAAISTGLPFALVLLFMLWSMRRAFDEELDLLEGHYDARRYASRHETLLEGEYPSLGTDATHPHAEEEAEEADRAGR